MCMFVCPFRVPGMVPEQNQTLDGGVSTESFQLRLWIINFASVNLGICTLDLAQWLGCADCLALAHPFTCTHDGLWDL